MKGNRNVLMMMLTLVLAVLAACGNASEKSTAKSDKDTQDSSPPQHEDGSASNKDATNTDSNPAEDISTDAQGEDSTSTYSDEKEALNSSNSDSEMKEGKKEAYLKKLNAMEEADRNAEVRTTTSEMEKQEQERYKKWDKELNDIYGELEKELSEEQMAALREEQREWIKHRDEAAKEASLKYEGGTTERLEYVATQASLTRERCYELVAHYME